MLDLSVEREAAERVSQGIKKFMQHPGITHHTRIGLSAEQRIGRSRSAYIICSARIDYVEVHTVLNRHVDISANL